MAQVGIAVRTDELGSAHAIARIRLLLDAGLFELTMKTRPAAARMEFAFRVEQGMITAHTVIGSLLEVVTVFTFERRFGSGFPGDAVLLSREFLPPFLL